MILAALPLKLYRSDEEDWLFGVLKSTRLRWCSGGAGNAKKKVSLAETRGARRAFWFLPVCPASWVRAPHDQRARDFKIF